jgi:hypothetical protein
MAGLQTIKMDGADRAGLAGDCRIAICDDAGFPLTSAVPALGDGIANQHGKYPLTRPLRLLRS